MIEKSVTEYRYYYDWIIQVFEERLLEQKLLKEDYGSREEFTVFLIIMLRSAKKLHKEAVASKTNKSVNEYITEYYKKLKNIKHLGVTIHGIARQSNVPRTTVKRIVDRLIEKRLVTKNIDNMIVPTPLSREKLTSYRKYLFLSNKRLNRIYNDSHLENIDPEDSSL